MQDPIATRDGRVPNTGSAFGKRRSIGGRLAHEIESRAGSAPCQAISGSFTTG